MPDRPQPAQPSTAPGPLIIVIEDEPQIRRFLRAALAVNGYRLFEAASGREGIQAVETRQPDLVLLDLGLPDIDGLDLIRRVRAWTAVPIVVLSARGQEADKVAALDAGADDYLAKPFGVKELLARIRVSLRHAQRLGDHGEQRFATGDLEVDLAQRRVRVKGRDVHLTPIEYRLLTMLVRHAGKVVTRNQLLTEVWGRPYSAQAHYLHVHVAELRRKLEDTPARPRYVLTEPGVGYRLASDDS